MVEVTIKMYFCSLIFLKFFHKTIYLKNNKFSSNPKSQLTNNAKKKLKEFVSNFPLPIIWRKKICWYIFHFIPNLKFSKKNYLRLWVFMFITVRHTIMFICSLLLVHIAQILEESGDQLKPLNSIITSDTCFYRRIM